MPPLKQVRIGSVHKYGAACFSYRNLLVLSREWMGMGEWGNGMIITSDYGPFLHSLLSTSKIVDSLLLMAQ